MILVLPHTVYPITDYTNSKDFYKPLYTCIFHYQRIENSCCNMSALPYVACQMLLNALVNVLMLVTDKINSCCKEIFSRRSMHVPSGESSITNALCIGYAIPS